MILSNHNFQEHHQQIVLELGPFHLSSLQQQWLVNESQKLEWTTSPDKRMRIYTWDYEYRLKLQNKSMMSRESFSVDITLYSVDDPPSPSDTVSLTSPHCECAIWIDIYSLRHISSHSTNFQRSLTANILNAYGKSISPSCQKTTAWSTTRTFCVCTQTLHTFKLLLYFCEAIVGHRIWSQMLVLSFVTDQRFSLLMEVS